MAWQDTYFVKIDGVSYKAALIRRAQELSKVRPLRLADAQALWELALDGKGVTATERRTLQHILAAFPLRGDAKAFLEGKLGEEPAPGPAGAGSGCGSASAGSAAEPEAGGFATWAWQRLSGLWGGRVSSAAGLARMAAWRARWARDGRLHLHDVQALVKSTIDKLGKTEAARRMLERIAADFAFTEAALELLSHKLSLLGSPSAPAHCPPGAEGPKPPKKKKKGTFTAVFFNPGNDPLEPLLDVLESASRSLDVAIFMLTDDRLAAALIRQHKAGVKVRVLADNDAEHAFDTSDLEKLRKAGIEVRLDRSKVHMHHKFAVADREVCVNGSLNWTTGALRNNRENIVISRCAAVSAVFAAEFERLWDAFGPKAPKGSDEPAPAPDGEWHGDQLVLFFPDRDDANFKKLVAQVSSAKKTLDVAVFTLTVPELKTAMKDAKARGVRVRVITDDRQGKYLQGGKHVKELRAAGLEVRMDGAGGNMHHKFCVIDGMTVCNGSFNWTRQAEDGNNENVIIHRNDPGLAHSFTQEFERLWAEFGHKK